MIASETAKLHTAGTHRSRVPSDTLAYLKAKFSLMGITRLSSITTLDDLGIPVYQAVRPNSRVLSVSTGKGITDELAAISAIMESAEYFHLERAPEMARSMPFGDVAASLPYDPRDLPTRDPNLLGEHSVIKWVPAFVVPSRQDTFVPLQVIDLSGIATNEWSAPAFRNVPAGLGCGNCLEEALVHALCEIVEHECVAAVMGLPQQERVYLDLGSVPEGPARGLLDRYRDKGNHVEVIDASDHMGIAVFRAVIQSSRHPVRYAGRGCHPDPEVALCRALTEAAQSRNSVLSGLRDEFGWRHWGLGSSLSFQEAQEGVTKWRRFEDVPQTQFNDFVEDLNFMVNLILERTGCYPMAVDLSQSDIGIPMFVAIAPKMRFMRDK